MKSVLLDSSSLILLYKANLLEPLCTNLVPMIVPAVFYEISQPQKPGSLSLQKFVEDNRIRLLQPPKNTGTENQQFHFLDPGERETLTYFLQGQGQYMIIDDLQAIRICIKNEFPFINALLVPKILYFSQRIDAQTFKKTFNNIKSKGYYSPAVIEKAVSFLPHHLDHFLP